MKDPLGIMGAETIFTMENYFANVIQAFENMEKFKAGVVHKTYSLPYYSDELEQSCTDHTSTTTGEIFHGFQLYLTYN